MNRKQMEAQAQYIRRIRGISTKKLKRVITNNFKNLAKTLKITNNGIVGDFDKFDKGMLIILNDTYKNISRSILKKFKKAYNLDKKVSNFKSIEKKVINNFNKKEAGKTIKNIGKVTKNRINKILLNGQKEGLNNKVIAKKIKGNVRGMGKSRSLTIARTETAKATAKVNESIAQETLTSKKVWLHSGGGKTHRKNHAAISGEEQDIDKLFSIGLMHDHEVGASADEIINCYCTTIYKY